VMARYNLFAEQAGIKEICDLQPDESIVETVAQLE